VCLALPLSVFASRTEMQNNVPNRGDFPMGPTSFDLKVQRGESLTETLEITNRSGKEQSYNVEVEDFEGSTTDPTQASNLKGSMAGKYGAKSWLTPEVNNFSLQHGERFFMEVKIQVPMSADFGDHYGAVLVSSLDPSQVKSSSGVNVMITSRVGSLFLLRVEGPIVEKGSLESFTTNKSFYEKGPIDFQVIYKNEGTVRLLPSGAITVKNLLGQTTEKIQIENFKVLRDSQRLNNIVLNKKNLFGRYTATVALDRGYGNIVDTKSITFWVFPVKESVAVVVLLVFILFFILMLIRKRKHNRNKGKLKREKKNG